MVASLLGETSACCATCRTSATSRVVRGLLEIHGVTVTPGVEPGELLLDPATCAARTCGEIDAHAGSAASRSCSAARCCTGSARRSSPTSAAAASATARSTSTSTRCATFGAVVDKLPTGIRLSAPNGLHGAQHRTCRTRASARPSRCCSPPCGPRASPSCGTRRSSPRSWTSSRSCRRWARSSRSSRTASSSSRASTSSSGYTHRAIFDRNEAASWASAALATAGRRLRAAARSSEHMMTFLNIFRKVGGAFDIAGGRHPLLAPGRRAEAGRDRDRRAPRLHDRLAAAAHRGAHAGRGRLHRARDRVREPVRLHRGAAEDGRGHRVHQRRPRGPAPPRAAPRARAGRRHHRPDAAARRRHRGARPARRLQPPDRGADRRGHARPSATSGSSAAATRTSSDKLGALGARFTVDG